MSATTALGTVFLYCSGCHVSWRLGKQISPWETLLLTLSLPLSVFSGDYSHRKQSGPGGPAGRHVWGSQAVCWGERWARHTEHENVGGTRKDGFKWRKYTIHRLKMNQNTPWAKASFKTDCSLLSSNKIIISDPQKCLNIHNKKCCLFILFRMFILEALKAEYKKQKKQKLRKIKWGEILKEGANKDLLFEACQLGTTFYWLRHHRVCFMFCRSVVSGSERKNVSLHHFSVRAWTLPFASFTHVCVYAPRYRGENVEDAFLEAAKKIYQNIQDGSLDLNAAESGVQHKPSAPQGGRLTSEPQPQREGCGC